MLERPTHDERFLYSDIVRQLHDRLQTELAADPNVSTAEASNANSDAVIAQWQKIWGAIPSDDAKSYANAMDKLFNKCWEGTNYVVSVLEQWFSHPGMASDTVCGEGAPQLKAARVEYFKCHGVVMPPEEVARKVQEINEAMKVKKIYVLDVGSCHGGLLAAAPRWMHVAAVDLCPAKPEVLQGDWLSLELVEGDDDVSIVGPYTVRGEAQSSQLLAVSCGSIDVIVMCYMLSFLPSGALRWEGVKRAMKVLRCGGLLLIMEPRRGAHHNQWHKKWTRVLASSLGCETVRTELMVHTASLLLRKPAEWSEACVGLSGSLDFS